MPYKITGIGRSRERPTVFIILSSLYSVQLYLVWSQKLHQNALSYPCDSTNAKMRTQNHSHAQVHFNFHFLSFIFTIFFLFSLSLSRALFPYSLSHAFCSYSLVYIFFHNTHTHTCTHTYTRAYSISSQFDWLHLCALMQNKAYYTLTYLSKDIT